MGSIDPNTLNIGDSDVQEITGKHGKPGKPYNEELDKAHVTALAKKFAELDKAQTDDKANKTSRNILGSRKEEG